VPGPICNNGATMMMCTMGMAPSNLIVLPVNMVMAENQPMANIQDFKPIVNIPPFGMCQSPANPTVAAATAAALGVLTPMPCVPMTTAPWVPGNPMVMVANQPALDMNSKCMCNWGGVISITKPGGTTVQFG
jgi:hypothetical protein